VQTAASGTITGNLIGVQGVVLNSVDATISGTNPELIGVLAKVSSAADNAVINFSGTRPMAGNWARAAMFRSGFMDHNAAGTGGTNRPAISTGITVDIPGFSTVTGKQYGLEVIASTATKATGQNNGDAITSAAAYLDFPNRGYCPGCSPVAVTNKLAHMYFDPIDGSITNSATAGGVDGWNLDGGAYFDSGAVRTKGLYQYVGAWRRSTHTGDCLDWKATKGDFAGLGITEYVSLSSATVNAVETLVDDTLTPAALTFHTLRVRSDTQPGGADTYTVTLRNALAGTALTCVVTSASNTCFDTTNRVNIAADVKVDLEFVPTATAANPAEVLISLCTAPQ